MTNAFHESEQIAIRCVLMRAGTSKGVYLLEQDIPAPGPLRDTVLKRIMGTPDVMQIDGLGGTHLITSKIAIVGRSDRADADVEYTFAQTDIDKDVIDYECNCGNISTGVGPFAIDAGLVAVNNGITIVRVHNTNTDKLMYAHVPVVNGRAAVLGNFAIAGVPGSGAEIFLDYKDTVGAYSGRALPTGNVIDKVELEDGRSIEATICDSASINIFVRAEDLGLSGDEGPNEVNNNSALVNVIREIRGKVGVKLGFCSSWKTVDDESPMIPLLVFVAPPGDYVALNGIEVKRSESDLRARFIFMNRCHEAMAGAGSICISTASRIVGSIINQMLPQGAQDTNEVRIAHPLGVMIVRVKCKPSATDVSLKFEQLGFARTARRIMDGFVYVPRDIFDS